MAAFSFIFTFCWFHTNDFAIAAHCFCILLHSHTFLLCFFFRYYGFVICDVVCEIHNSHLILNSSPVHMCVCVCCVTLKPWSMCSYNLEQLITPTIIKPTINCDSRKREWNKKGKTNHKHMKEIDTKKKWIYYDGREWEGALMFMCPLFSLSLIIALVDDVFNAWVCVRFGSFCQRLASSATPMCWKPWHFRQWIVAVFSSSSFSSSPNVSYAFVVHSL